MDEARDQALEAAAFVGETLGPLFLYDPADEAVAPVYEAIGELDAAEAAVEWPLAAPAEAQEALRLMEDGLRGGVDDELIWEYRRLFAGPAAKAAPPWGSVYTDRECVIFGEATLELRRWLREAGIEVPGTGKEPEDHIGLMLVLMAWLARQRPELLDEYLAQHLLTWAPHFLGIVQQESQHPFFCGLAQLTGASLAGLQDALQLSVDVPRFYR